MTRWFPVRASRLHKRQLVVGSTEIRQATLFPFFDGSGEAEHVMIVDADSSELQTFALTTTQITIPRWGPIRVDGPIDRLNDDVIERLAPLWHFDPWWLLRDERFAFHWAGPILKATNCAESFDRLPTNVCFNGRLDKLVWMIYSSTSKGYEIKRFQPDTLPAQTPERPKTQEKRLRGWQLMPFWQ